jgi:GT2 family glycosyltransferase
MQRRVFAALRALVRRFPWLRRRLLRRLAPVLPMLSRRIAEASASPYAAWFARWQASRPDLAADAPPLPWLVLVAPGAAGAATRAALAAQLRAAPVVLEDGSPEVPAALAACATEGGRLLLLTGGETLVAHALPALAKSGMAAPRAPILLADEDAVDADGIHAEPWFKTPAFDPDRLLQQDSFGAGVAYDAAFLLRHGLGETRGHALALAASRAALQEAGSGAIRHLPAVLVHRPAGTPPPWRARTNPAAVAVHLDGATLDADATRRPLQLHWPLPDPAPLVSIIIPTRDRLDLLRPCVEGLLHRTDYPALEVLIADNESADPATLAAFAAWQRDGRVRVLPAPGAFNYSAINNEAVDAARGEIVVLLNNDTEVLHPNWLREMVSLALRPGIGAVGALLLFLDGRVQHAGVVAGMGGVAGHDLLFSPGEADGPQDDLRLLRSVSAVTAACLAIRRETFLAVGGLDEAALRVAYNDVDFCLKVRAAGFRNLITPHARLLHRESASRGSDFTDARQALWEAECATMQQRWSGALGADPWFSPQYRLDNPFRTLAEPPGA